MMPVVHSPVVSVAPFLKVYRRQRTWGLRASGGSVCSSTTPLTVLLSSASFPDSAKLASGGGFSSWEAPPPCSGDSSLGLHCVHTCHFQIWWE